MVDESEEGGVVEVAKGGEGGTWRKKELEGAALRAS